MPVHALVVALAAPQLDLDLGLGGAVKCDPDLPGSQSPVPHDYESAGEEYGSPGDGGSYEILRCRSCKRIAYQPLPD